MISHQLSGIARTVMGEPVPPNGRGVDDRDKPYLMHPIEWLLKCCSGHDAFPVRG
jgi:hypothetical protein